MKKCLEISHLMVCVNYIIKNLFHGKNDKKPFERKNNDRKTFGILKGSKGLKNPGRLLNVFCVRSIYVLCLRGYRLLTCGKFVTELLIFAEANIFFQLTLEYIGHSRTGLFSGLLLQKH